MFILIAGGGIVGRNITKSLAKNHDIVVIDKDEKNCEIIASKYGAVAINGDATNIRTLKDAGIEKADYALGVMRYDAQNLLFSLLAKNFNIKNIFVRMRDPEYKEAYEIAGATNIAHTVDMMTKKFIYDIENPEIRTVASLRNGRADISIITIPKKSWVFGKSISEITKMRNFPKEIVVAGIFNQDLDKFIVPRGDTIVEKNCQIFIVGKKENIKNAYEILVK
ncbi:potassium channel family protein [Helicovermis profundi]|uniref:Trk system potassium uptake protein TrkA n=1 Tax=Helicovermis profundi TaxID=3065157 RepID=A0AAU9ENT6_9FIRM|nr:TrkA family potassium uptake protein [Clostridia bacterium S502]